MGLWYLVANTEKVRLGFMPYKQLIVHWPAFEVWVCILSCQLGVSLFEFRKCRGEYSDKVSE